MNAEKSHTPNTRATFAYSLPQDQLENTYDMPFVGDVAEEWVIYDVEPDTSVIEVAQCEDLPQPGDDAGWSEYYLVNRIENLHDTGAIDPDNSNTVWKCIITYLPDPMQLPTEIHLSGNRVMRVVDHDEETGKAIVNPAGDPYNPLVQEARGLLRIRIIKRYAFDDFDGEDIEGFEDHINEEDWVVPGIGTVPAGDAFIAMIDAPLVKEPIWHFQVEFQVEIDRTNLVTTDEGQTDIGFDQYILNCGYQYLTTPVGQSNSQKHLFADDHGISHGGIGLLKADGTKLDPTSDDPTYTRWKTKPKIDFNSLALFG
jgi:hypothetical protein